MGIFYQIEDHIVIKSDVEKTYNPAGETEIYQKWEKSGIFTPIVPDDPKSAKKVKKPFSVILPPPNANEPLHAGHALYVVEDILIRHHRMLGDPTLWLPGTDHAGIETQFVYEKHLKMEGKSRFDFDRETLYQMIAEYVNKNRDIAKNQLKRLGFSLDWTRERFTLDEEHNKRIFAVFKRMINEGLIYRDEKIVNYCTFCGTAFSNLEVEHKTVSSHLWYFKYPLEDGSSYIEVATTRPETMLGDTAVAVNPKDKRYQQLIGKNVKLPIVNKLIPIIGEETVSLEFGTGAVKVTPSHSPEDYEMAKKHNLEFVRIFDYDGRTNINAGENFVGLFPSQLRSSVVEEMDKLGLLSKIEDYSHEVGHCYKCGRPIEPITAPQWFVKIQPLAQKAVEAVSKDKVVIFPKRFKKSFLTWMKDIKDWPISRQIIWGHRIPVWYNLDDNEDIRITYIDKNGETSSHNWNTIKKQKINFEEVKKGLQSLMAPVDMTFYLSEEEALTKGNYVLQETDTFDTWFSSGQWPYSTLGWDPEGNHNPDFEYFYPTTVLDTMWDILFFWVARMIMMGIYATGEIPFEVAHMHSRVLDGKGQKMSKSKGNTINPVDIAEKYGADALRMALVIGVAPGSDIALSEDKIRAQRNFVNKIWNATRFVSMMVDKAKDQGNTINGVFGYPNNTKLTDDDKAILKKLNSVIKSNKENIEKYRFGQASEDLYQFFWHDFCDVYIEQVKERFIDALPILGRVLVDSLKMLHPFIPFVTEAAYQQVRLDFGIKEELLANAPWPEQI